MIEQSTELAILKGFLARVRTHAESRPLKSGRRNARFALRMRGL
jgi:hypothetical protein